MRLFEFEDVPRELDGRDLHAETQAQIWNVVLARKLCRLDLAFNAALAETTGHKYPAQPFEHFCSAILFDLLGFDAHDLHAAIVSNAAVHDRLIDGLVGILQTDVFPDD